VPTEKTVAVLLDCPAAAATSMEITSPFINTVTSGLRRSSIAAKHGAAI